MGKNGNGNGKSSGKSGKSFLPVGQDLNPFPKDGSKRDDWVLNHWTMTKFIEEYVQKENKFPTNTEIGKGIGLTEETVAKHRKFLKFSRFKEYSVLSDRVIMAVFNEAVKGSSSHAKLWFQIVEGWSEKFDHNLNKSDWRDFQDRLTDAKDYKSRIKALNNFLLAGNSSG